MARVYSLLSIGYKLKQFRNSASMKLASIKSKQDKDLKGIKVLTNVNSIRTLVSLLKERKEKGTLVIRPLFRY